MSRDFVSAEESDPIAVFLGWLAEAESTEINDPNAAALATATREGAPSVRMVLLKQVDGRGFVFFTNAESQKGRELKENPVAAMCFHWKSQQRQVRVEGTVAALPGFVAIQSAMKAIANPLLNEAITVTALAGMTGSASGGLSLALAAMAGQFKAAAIANHGEMPAPTLGTAVLHNSD